MSALANFREPIRVLIGDNDPDIQLREDAQLDAAMRMVVNMGKVVSANGATTYAQSDDYTLTPDLTPTGDPYAWSLLVLHAAKWFVTDTRVESFRTRAFSEAVGEGREKVLAVLDELYRLENGAEGASSAWT